MAIEIFRAKLKEYLRLGGYSQKQLAFALEMHPAMLSNKLNAHNYGNLTYTEVKQIVKILAEWRVLTSQDQALELLALMGLNYASFSLQEWNQSPLADLEPLTKGQTSWTQPRPEPELNLESANLTHKLPLADSFKLIPPNSTSKSAHPAHQSSTNTRNGSPTQDQILALLPPIPLHLPSRRENWQGAIISGPFYNRQKELHTLKQWVLEEKCRVVAVLGMGGMGKTSLTVQLVHQLKAQFDFVIWHSLYNAPPFENLLNDILQFLAGPGPVELSAGIEAKLSRLLAILQDRSVLLVLDNWETIFQGGSLVGRYRPPYEEYGKLIEQLGQTNHRSCLLLTSREKPFELGLIEAKMNNKVASLSLTGLAAEEGQLILQDLGLAGNAESQKVLVERYRGNPLALKLVAEPVQTVFGGRVEAFLAENWTVFGEIEQVLAEQLKRLSKLEQQLVYWLALAREPLSLHELEQNLALASSGKQIAEALISLARRNLLEREQNQPRFSLQPVVLEYLTGQLVEQATEELIRGQLHLVQTYALLQAEAKDYVRASQRRLILRPILEQLLTQFSNQQPLVEAHLVQLLSKIREQPFERQGYSGGNLINLLCLLKGNLSGYDFSGLRVWQADLQGIELQEVNFARSDLGRSTFTQAFDSIAAVAFSPDGRLVAGGCYNGMVRVWEVASGQLLLECAGHSASVWSVAFNPDGRTLVSSSADHCIRVWEVATGEGLQIWRGHSNAVWSIAFSPDGKFLVSGSADQTIKLWEVASNQCVKILPVLGSEIRSVAFSPDGRTVASGSTNQLVKLWDIASGECLKTWQGHSNMIMSVAFSPDGYTIASGSTDQTVKVWEVSTGECLQTLQGHSNWIMSVAFSPDGSTLASGGADQTIRLWEVMSGKCLKTWQGHSNIVYSVAFSPDGGSLVSASSDQTIKVWEVASGECLKTWQGYINLIWSVAFSSDSRTLAGSSADQTIKLWDIASGKYLKALQGHSLEVRGVAFSPVSRILASGGFDQTIKLWEVDRGECLNTLRGHTNIVFSVAFSPDGGTLASGSTDQTIKVWEVDSGECLKTLRGHTNTVWSVAFSPDGRLLASGSLDQTVRLWDIASEECLHTWQGQSGLAVMSVAFSPNSRTIASGGTDQLIKLWNIASGECLNTLEGHNSMVMSVAFSPDGQLLASSSADETVKLWDIASGKCLKTLQGHNNWVWSVAFSSAGDILASGGADQSVKLWEIASGECLKTLRAWRPYEGMHIRGVTGISEAQRANLQALGAVLG